MTARAEERPSSRTVEVDRHGPTAVVTLSRPHRANTLTADLLTELRAVQYDLEQDDDVRVVVVTGAGRHFCGGRDLGDATPTRPDAGIGFELLTKPVIAAINGAALGGGCEVALACDFRYAAADASIGLPEIRFGELPAGGGTARLARLVGVPAAKRLIMTGEPLTASEAVGIGLVDHVCAPEDLRDVVLAFAGQLAAAAPYAIRTAKLLIDRSVQTDLATALAMERQVTATMAGPAEREQARADAARRDATYARIFTAGRD